jgi:hypothetical protein
MQGQLPIETYEPVPGRWETGRINRWYDALPWLVGCNYYPATAINQIDMWQASTFDLPTIEKELDLAASISMNTLRVYLHDLVHADDEAGLYERMDRFLDACTRRGIRPMIVFFDDCHYPDAALGNQPPAVSGWHNNGWVSSPRKDVLLRYAAGDKDETLRRYVVETIRHFKDDDRILAWELYNEPGRGEVGGVIVETTNQPVGQVGDASNTLLHDAWTWAREVDPSQPITSTTLGCVGEGNLHIGRVNSDFHSIHLYNPPPATLREIRDYQNDGRPIFATEWLNRHQGNLVETILPLLKRERVAAVHWGFVLGKSQTHVPWWSRQRLDDDGQVVTLQDLRNAGHVHRDGDPWPDPPLWFHDLFRPDHTPYDPAEIEVFRRLTQSS